MPRRRPEDPPATARRAAVLAAAQGVFLRYGFKKTSMDDLARAAGLSRQGLYLQFQTKEALFKAVLEHLMAQLETTARAALARDDAAIEDRLVAGFEAFYGRMIELESGHFDELFETATALVGPLHEEMEGKFAAAIAGVLSREGVAAAWKPAGISAKDLAEHLCATATGIKHAAKTLAAFRARMRTAVRIAVRGASR
jgi:AcrR family transcriptional regulator